MKTLITTRSPVATITLANADRPKVNYQPVVDINNYPPLRPQLDAWRAYRAERRAAFRTQTVKAKEKAVAKRQEVKQTCADHSRIFVCREDG